MRQFLKYSLMLGTCVCYTNLLMAYLYSPEDIAGFLLEEKVAIHGVSPEVYEQNQNLIQELGRAARASSEALISVQIIGSRSNGSSGLNSDLDLVAVTFEADNAHTDRERLFNAAHGLKVSTDIGLAASATGAHSEVPADAADFVSWVDNTTHFASSLFEEGLFASPDQRLGQLAVTSILRANSIESEIAEQWQSIRLWHADTYLGDIDQMREKLTERLGVDQSVIRTSISNDLMRQRRSKFALPTDMKAYHTRLQRWANRNKSKLQKRQAWQLYQDVLGEL